MEIKYLQKSLKIRELINHTIDFTCKRIFGSSGSKNILKSFLNALIYEGKPIIEYIEILDWALASQISG